MAHEMCQAVGDLAQFWHQRGGSIGFGVGIAQGYATIGQVGFEGRVEYSAIGTVTNLAARICAEALNGQILVSQRIANAAEEFAELSPPQELILKGLSKPIQVYDVVGLRP
jgi:class 3 adenylate cyclase